MQDKMTIRSILPNRWRAVDGFEAALARGAQRSGGRYSFIEAPQSLEEMQKITATFAAEIPFFANMVQAKNAIRTANDLEQLGYKMAIFPGGAVRAIALHLQVIIEDC